jgi:MoaA/NifB/PqqE/SkfB family radical SAM enzyme
MPFTIDYITAVKKRVITDDIVNRFWIKDERLDLLDSTLDELKKLKHEHGVLLNPDSHLDLMKVYYRNPSQINRECRIGAYSIGFAGDGSVVVCGELGVVGNIREASLQKIWNSQAFKKARLKMSSCHKCILNCQYTPSHIDLIKDFIVYPIVRRIK